MFDMNSKIPFAMPLKDLLEFVPQDRLNDFLSRYGVEAPTEGAVKAPPKAKEKKEYSHDGEVCNLIEFNKDNYKLVLPANVFNPAFVKGQHVVTKKAEIPSFLWNKDNPGGKGYLIPRHPDHLKVCLRLLHDTFKGAKLVMGDQVIQLGQPVE